jgi:hypothetical protein
VGITTSGPVALSRTGGPGVFAFPSTQKVNFNTGNLDYSTFLFGMGTLNITGLNGTNQAASGTLQSDGSGNLTLTIPVLADIFYDIGGGASFTIHMSGTLTATGTLGTAPTVGSFQLGGAQPAASEALTGVPANGLGSPNLASAAPVADTVLTPAPVSASHFVPVAPQNSTAAVDTIFGDPIVSGVLPF